VGIYCHPEVAFAGPVEEAAKDAGYDVVVSKHRWGGNSRALILGETDGLVKVIAEKNADGTAGPSSACTWSGPWVTEQLSGATWPSTGRPPSTRSPSSSSPTRRSRRLLRRTVLSLTGRSLNA
jgi:dihydrolipoamide dehydrogenase